MRASPGDAHRALIYTAHVVRQTERQTGALHKAMTAARRGVPARTLTATPASGAPSDPTGRDALRIDPADRDLDDYYELVEYLAECAHRLDLLTRRWLPLAGRGPCSAGCWREAARDRGGRCDACAKRIYRAA